MAMAAVAALTWTTAAGPAWADDDGLTLEERLNWSTAERTAHGEKLRAGGEDATEPAIPATDVTAGEPEPLPGAGEEPTDAEAAMLATQAAAARAAAQGPVEMTVSDPDVRAATQPDAVADDVGAVGGLFSLTSVPEAGSEETAGAKELASEGKTSGMQSSQGASEAGDKVRVSVDVTHLAGGDLATRLVPVHLPACALTSPQEPACQAGTPLEDVDLVTKDGRTVLSAAADAPEPAAPTGSTATSQASARVAERAAESDTAVVALMADEQGPNGDWGATKLAAASAWDVSAQTGAFSWSYPMRTPPVPGGLAPDLEFSYSSASLDGRVASGNAQASIVGDGWEADLSGYVERKYVPCTDDQDPKNGQAANNVSRDTGDLCWRTNNLTLSFNGSATELVRDGDTNTWRAKSDDNIRVARHTGGWGGAINDTEYFIVTTRDGTRYYFGRGKTESTGADLGSVQHVPVFGNHPGEPCNATTYAASRCAMGYRWNLDHVIDPRGNTITYTYTKDTNRYGYNNNAGTTVYVSGSRLMNIEYGTRTGATGDAPARVELTYAQRCIPSSSFACAVADRTVENGTHWPDLPLDQFCTSTSSCPSVQSPVFYDIHRLTKVATFVRASTGFVPVDSWALTQELPAVGATMRTVWLDKIVHTGHGANTNDNDDEAMPAVDFDGTDLVNRASSGDDENSMTRLRIIAIRTETGGRIAVAYSGAECSPSSLPANAWSNTKRCFPVYWTRSGAEEPAVDWFHHYRVEKVTESAGTAIGGTPVMTDYAYTGGPAWHYDDNELVDPKNRTWGELRGYSQVEVIVGDRGNTAAPPLHTQYDYFRGMHGDYNNAALSTRKSVKVDTYDDSDQYAGMVRRETTLNGSAVVKAVTSGPWSRRTATDPEGVDASSYFLRVAAQETAVTAPAAAGGVRTSRVQTEYDPDYGMPTDVSDLGNTAVTGDERCTTTTYARNTSANIVDLVAGVKVYSGVCLEEGEPAAADVISHNQTFYDEGTFGSAPTRGLVTRTEALDSYNGATAVYVPTARTTYEEPGTGYARALTVTDAKDRVTRTAYTDPLGLTTRTVATSPDPDGSGPLDRHVTTTEIQPAWGLPTKVTDPDGKITTGVYDRLGRLRHVWKPGRTSTQTPDLSYTYAVAASGLNTVTSLTLNHDGSVQRKSVDVYDGLLRHIQNQTPSADVRNPGRVMTDTIYDSRGLAVITNDGWRNSSAPAASLAVPTFAVPARTYSSFDGAGRVVESTFHVGEDGVPDDHGNYSPQWTTTTSYAGDRVHVDPPTGGTPTTTISDVRGNTTALWQYTGPAPTGTHHVTSYRYDDADQLVGVNDPAGNEWTYTYDLRGRQTSATDPDKGTSSTNYDTVGNVETTTDSRGRTLAYQYDALGRKTSLHAETTTGAERARWVYDTLAVGQLTSATRITGAGNYVTAVTGYTNRYQPTGQSLTLPNDSALGDLAGDTFTTGFTYTVDGRVRTTSLPAVGSNLPAEMVETMFDEANQPTALYGEYPSPVYRAHYSPYGPLEYLDQGTAYTDTTDLRYEYGTRRLAQRVVTKEQTDNSSTTVQNAAYAWDDAGNLSSVKDTPQTGGADRQCYRYDWANRLTHAWTPSSGDCAATPSVAGLGGVEPYWTTWTHDTIGNRLTATGRTLDGTTSATYAHPDARAARPHSTTGVTSAATGTGTSGNASFSYDAAGNTTGRSLTTTTSAGTTNQVVQALTWDLEGELATVGADTNGDGDTEDSGEPTAGGRYVYSAEGDRLVRTQGTGTGKSTTVYLPGGQEATITASGGVTGTRYFSFNGTTVASRNGPASSNLTTIIPDQHGTPGLQINDLRTTVTRNRTDPYGAPRGTTTPGDTGTTQAGQPGTGLPTGWAGDHGYLDKPTDTTGLTAIGARMYDPILGAFASVDPVMDLADPQQWHGYTYAHNNPTTFSDPTGLRETCEDGYTCRYNPGGDIADARPTKPPVEPVEPDDEESPPVDIFDENEAAGEVLDRAKGNTEKNPLTFGTPIDSYVNEAIIDGLRFFSRLNIVGSLIQGGFSARDYCTVLDCTRSGWGGFYKDGRFWLAATQTVVGWTLPLIGGAGGMIVGSAAVGVLGAVVGTMLGPVPGNAIGGAVGLTIGAAFGGAVGAAAGSNTANQANGELRNFWRGNRWLD